MTRSLYLFIISLRPKQWLKNTIIFLPLVFASKLFDFSAIIDTSIIFILFSLFVGTTYILNDLKDIQKDALHPIKSRRPLASGALNHRFA
jgi:4-hydroxybenzoate polyprenyltransferase